MSHRAGLAEAAKIAGYDVSLVTQVGRHAETIRAAGITLWPICFPRSFRRPWQDLLTLPGIYRAYRGIKPDLLHHVSLKPIVYGSLVVRLGACAGKPPVIINAFTGLGYVFTSGDATAKLLRAVLTPVLKLLVGGSNSYLLFQNEDDMHTLIDSGIASEDRCRVIPGSGVDVRKFTVTEAPAGAPVIMLVARMLYDKGVEDFVNAARLAKAHLPQARFVLVGDTDPENPAAIPISQLQAWHDEKVIEWWGRRDDMPAVYAQAHIVVLPSHREGFPKTIIEAAACGRPVITTDVPGCRDAIVPGETGLRVPAKDPESLAAAIRQLVADPEVCIAMGRAGRQRVEDRYSSAVINSQILNLYQCILAEKTNRDTV